MKSVLFALGLGALRVLAQDELEEERQNVCALTLQAGDADVYRTNDDWTLTNTDDNGRLTRAQFYLTEASTGRMYGGSGERCGFDPYLECDDDADDEQDRGPFVVSSNSSLTFGGSAVFYLCDRNSFVSTDPDDQDDPEDLNNPDDLAAYPYIYPPIGTTNNTPRNYENCTAVLLTASGCQEGSNAFTVSPSAALQTPNPTGTGSGNTAATNTGGNAATTSPAGSTGAANSAGLSITLVTAGVLVSAMGFAWL